MKLKNIVYAVPTVDMYDTSAYQLSPKEVEETAEFFTKFKEMGIDVEKTNPVEVYGKDIEKVTPTNPNVKSLKGAKAFRSCYYNSHYSTLESKFGIFVSQAVHFKDKKYAKVFKEQLNEKFDRMNYTVFLQKGNVQAAVNMYHPEAEPTYNFFELVEFVESKGFKILKRGRIHV